ncbi:hypothetical protein RQP46_000320 [Phenoliferia psychrophenolica]
MRSHFASSASSLPYRALAPAAGAVTELPAGGSITLEIACHIAWTSFGWSTTTPGSPLDACPSGTAGPYHSGDPNSYTIDPTLLSGCALGIANVDDISETTMDNIAIFSVQENCVQTKETTFQIPAMMPACTGSKCICAWFWLANTGTANFYMTAFDCNVTNVSPLATAISAPQDPVYCSSANSTCVTTPGAKRPLYVYNSPTNAVWPAWENPGDFNANRPGYHASWSFQNGAQNDIFEAVTAVIPPVVSKVASVVSSVVSRVAVTSAPTRATAVLNPKAAKLAAAASLASVASVSKAAASKLSLASARGRKVTISKREILPTPADSAVKARRTLALARNPAAVVQVATLYLDDVGLNSTHSASYDFAEQLRAARMLSLQFEEQEWSAKARGA